MDETHDVVVVGGGLAGLTAAAVAAEGGCSVLLLDGKPLGGRAATDQAGRFLFNRGAHGLYRSTVGRPVLDRLGVRVKGSLPVIAGAQGTLDERIGLLPLTPQSLARTRLLGGRDKVALSRAMLRIGLCKPESLAGVTAAQWFDDLGLQGAAREALTGLVRLTSYVADVDVVSADVAAVQLQAAFKASVDYLDGGWATLVDGLAQAARERGASIVSGARARAVVPDGARVAVEVDECTVLARRVVLATGTPEAMAALLPERPPAWSDLGPPAQVACLDLGLTEVPHPALVIGIDRPFYLSRHAPPANLAPDGAAVVHVMQYLTAGDDLSPQEARAGLEQHCLRAGVDPRRAEEARYLHRMAACAALPRPETGGMRGRPGIEVGLDGVLVAGDWVGPVGHLADASLASGEACGRAAVESIEREPVVLPVGGGSG